MPPRCRPSPIAWPPSICGKRRGTALAQSLAPLLAAHPGLSGIVPLRDDREALAVRIALADAAQRSLDVRYYIWSDDTSGRALAEALLRAARRGVRVRVLLDDINTGGLDAKLVAFDRPANVELRLFNPFVEREARVLGFLTDFDRLNRRMHNKSFSADNMATIVGGRNVGDEYFGAGSGIAFVDLDVLAVGPTVEDVSADFDRYWNSDSAYPVDEIVRRRAPPPASAPSSGATAAEPARAALGNSAVDTKIVPRLLAGDLPFEWAPTQLVSDDPAKALGKARGEDAVLPGLRRLFGEPQRELDLVSAYFVESDQGVELLSSWARSGVAVTVLTNSLAATDVAAVHAGYAPTRKPLLQAGVHLFELKPQLGSAPAGHGLGSSGASLHAKTFEVDRERIFVGSFNFDPRSRELNTEMGLVIDSPRLATDLADVFTARVPLDAWQVRLTAAGELQWVDLKSAETFDHDPGVPAWKRAWVRLLEWLPIRSLL